ncbi:PREDICTED: integumentary mucin A.1-like [Priapulus caudatus]|uniref:Integumentary mucin A.1-like n=1 Tax=Priapulus caudatus TaxID=37621 RepID=A0ABM1FAV4_PRICU|nr:PREDICTED: integumentary mucin A.1-like [Priapulus caudatus]
MAHTYTNFVWKAIDSSFQSTAQGNARNTISTIVPETPSTDTLEIVSVADITVADVTIADIATATNHLDFATDTTPTIRTDSTRQCQQGRLLTIADSRRRRAARKTQAPGRPVLAVSPMPRSTTPTPPATPSPQSQTEPTTEIPTEPTTEIPTEPTTEIPTEPTTEITTEILTEPTTEIPTEIPTEPTTEIPTDPATEMHPLTQLRTTDIGRRIN